MNARHCLSALLLMSVNTAAWACDLPTLVAIPAKRVGEDSARLIVAVQRYVEGVQSYTACVQAELAAAGGDAAPESLRNQLIVRNNGAVAEAGAVLALFGERLTPARNLYLAQFIAGDGEECIQTPGLDTTVVVNDIAVLFIERGGQIHLNVLEESCASLEASGNFDIRRGLTGAARGPTQMTRLCSKEFLEPFKFETRSIRNRECPLGRFFELTEEQAGRLLALRDAARPAAEEPAAGQAEETPAPPRAER